MLQLECKGFKKYTLMLRKMFMIFGIPFVAVLFFCFSQYQASIKGFDGGKKVPLSIEYGTSVKGIVAELYEKEIIDKEWPMLLYLKWYGKQNHLQAGDFIIQQGLPVEELVVQLSSGRVLEIPVRIIEGSTIEEIDNLLVSKALIEDGEFEKCAQKCKFPNYNFVYDGNIEGYLFPDTYFVEIDEFEVKSFIERLLTNFERRFLSDENKATYRDANRTLQQVVTMASIIEKEEWNTANMPMISGILWKRLDEWIPLGADATTRYYEGKKTEALVTADFQKDNPYNTRRKLGLPPTAIGSPGLKALEAALYPKSSKYYYYLHGNDGRIRYAITNDEHNQNKYKYLR